VKNNLQSLVDKQFKEPRDPSRDLAKFDKEVRSVLQVLNAEQMCKLLLDEATTALSVESGTILPAPNRG